MKAFYILLLSSLLFINNGLSQCPYDNTNAFGTISLAGCPGNTNLTCLNAGNEVGVNVISGNTYVFSTCASTTFDSELTLYDAAGVAVLGYNDDFCGVQSQITWTATYDGVVHILLDEFGCTSNATCMDLNIDCTIPVAGGSGCNTDNSICTSGTAGPFGFGTAGPDPGNCQDWLSTSQFSYIILYITQTGPLNILIAGDATSGFLDVSIYNIPSGQSPCTAILTPANLLGCNYASSYSGCNEFGTAFGCASTVPAPNVTAGQQVMIIVEDYGNGPSSNYTLQLAPAPAAQTGPPNPAITPAGPFCTSDPAVQLTAANMGGDWTGTGVSLTGLFDPAIAGPGTHTITYSIGQAPCVGISNTTIIVSGPPTVTVNNTTICGGQTAILVATPSATGGTYLWNTSATTDSISVSPNSTTSYSVVYTVGGCSSSSVSGTVTVNTFPAFTPAGTNPTICNASDGFISISGVTASTTYSVNYSDDGIPIAAASYTSNGSGIITIPNLNSGVYTLITLSSGGCSGTSPLTITLANPGAPTITNPGNQTACDSYTLPVISGTNLSGNQAYYNNSQALGGTMISGSLTSTQTVWIYDMNGTCSDEKSFIVTINGTPTVTVNNPTICQGSNASVTATPSTTGGTYVWTPSGNGTTQTISVSPASTSTYSVVYTLNGCPSSSVTSTVTVTAAPIVGVNSPNSCSGQTVPITATPAIPGGTFLWNTSDTTAVMNVSPITTTNYTVVYTLNGCASAPATGTVNVFSLPPLSAGADITICSGATGTLGLPSVAGYLYSWALNQTGLTNPNSAQPTVTLTNATTSPVTSTYIVDVIVSSTGCGSSDNVNVTVNPNPTVTVNNPTICEGTTATITATPSTIGGSYLWNTTETTQTISVSPSTTTSYSVVYTLNNCPSSSTTSTVTVNPAPIVSVNISDICIGQIATVTATPAIVGGTYLWNTSETTASINPSPAVTTSYSVVYTLNGCQSASTSGTVNVNALPPPSAGADITICSGDIGNIGINPTVGNTYSWTVNQTGLGSPNSSLTTVTLTNLTSSAISSTYTVDVLTPQGCTSSDDVIVTVDPIPTANFTADTLAGCAPLVVTFTNNSVPASTSALWNFGDGSSSSSSANTVTHSFTGSGCHDITLTTTTNNCSASFSIPQMICIQPNAIANFNVNKPSETVLNPTFVFTNNSLNATDYEWNFGDGNSSNVLAPIYQYADSARTYDVMLIASTDGACADTSILTIEVVDILIYYIPNTFTPDGDNFNQTFQPVFTSGFDPYQFQLLIMNRWGEVLFESHDAAVGWDGSYGGKIVSDGIYTWKIEFRDAITDKKYANSGNITLIR